MSDQEPFDLLEARRRFLRLGAGAALGTLLIGKIAMGEILKTPLETEGPFWEDEMLLRSDVRGDRTGLPLYLMVSVSKLANGVAKPLSNAFVDIWHGDAAGNYSDEPAGMGNANTLGQTWLRGYQITNARGIAKFTSIYPGWYVGRTPHIHARVRTYSGTTVTMNITTQFFFDDMVSDAVFSGVAPYTSRTGIRGTRNTNDMVFNTVSAGSTVAAPDGTRLMLRLSKTGVVFATASFNIVVI